MKPTLEDLARAVVAAAEKEDLAFSLRLNRALFALRDALPPLTKVQSKAGSKQAGRA